MHIYFYYINLLHITFWYLQLLNDHHRKPYGMQHVIMKSEGKKVVLVCLFVNKAIEPKECCQDGDFFHKSSNISWP